MIGEIFLKRYDSRAIKVMNGSNLRVGYITGTIAYPLSNMLDEYNAKLAASDRRFDMIGTILDAGDGKKQSLRVDLKVIKVATKTDQSNEEASRKDQNNTKASSNVKVEQQHAPHQKGMAENMIDCGPVTMVGVKSLDARAVPGEKVTLVRDPSNVSVPSMIIYDDDHFDLNFTNTHNASTYIC